MHGNHVATPSCCCCIPYLLEKSIVLVLEAPWQVQKCIEQMPPESVSFVVEAVEARSLGDCEWS